MSPCFALALQALLDGMQDIIWAFTPESANVDMDISVHHMFRSSVLNLMCNAADVSEDEPMPRP